MNKYHIMYTDKDGKFVNTEMRFTSFEAVENYLKVIGAIYWEIG